MRLLALALTVLLVGASSLPWVVRAEQSADVFSGTIEQLNAAEGKVTVKNEIGRNIALDLINPELLKGLTVGDHVSVELERPGTAKKITKLSVPELKAPLGSNQ
jgi:hypothetical protein